MLLLIVNAFDNPDAFEFGISIVELQLLSGVGDDDAVSCSQAEGPEWTLSFGGLISFMIAVFFDIL